MKSDISFGYNHQVPSCYWTDLCYVPPDDMSEFYQKASHFILGLCNFFAESGTFRNIWNYWTMNNKGIQFISALQTPQKVSVRCN